MPINLFAKRRAPAQAVRPDVARALEQLGKIAEAQPDLAELVASNVALLRAAFADVPVVAPLRFDAAHAAAKLEAGVSLLRGEALAIPGAMLRQRYGQLCEALAQQAGTHAATRANAAALKNAVMNGRLDVHALATDVLAGDPHTVAERAAAFDLDAGVAATLLRWTLLPLLEQYAKQLAPLREHTPWQHGYCPTCGAWPIFAEQRGIEQRRYLRCGVCTTDWAFERILCPFCGTRHHADIHYLFEAGHDNARAVTCERCHGYFKQINALVPTTTIMLPVADLQTVHLDLVALERAYAPPA